MNDYKIKELYEEMEKELISSMKRNLKRHLKEEEKTGFKYTQWQAEKLKELSRYRKQNKSIIGEYTSGINKEIAKHIQEEVKQGSVNAIKQYNKILGDKLKPSKVMNKSFFKTNDRKVNSLIKVVNNDMKTANSSVLRMANDQYSQVIHKSAFFVGNGAFTEQQASRIATEELSELKLTELAIDEANKPFLTGGLNCIQYKDGRRVNIASYSQMAVRTANLRAQLMGEGDFRKSIGRTLVQATSHGGACPICQKWEKHIFIDDVYSGGTKEDGKYMLLSEAMEQGFLHPSCRHGLTTYYPELDDIENETEEEYQSDIDYINERLNYIDRNIKKYDRLYSGSIASENVNMYKNKKKQWENEKDLLLSTNETSEDVTEEWLKLSTPNSHIVKDRKSYKIGDKIYRVRKGSTAVVLDYSQDEKLCAEWIEGVFGGKIYMNPRVNRPKKVNTADYLWRDELWDKKSLKNSKSLTRAFDNAIKDCQEQTGNFIVDLTGCELSNNTIINQVKNSFNSKSKLYRYWLQKVVIKRGNKLIKVIVKK